MFAQLLANAFDRRQPMPNPQPDDRSIAHLISDLVGTRGEISGRTLGQEILNRYINRFEDSEKRDFFEYLACEMDVDAGKVRQGLEAYEKTKSKSSYLAFQTASEPPRQELIRRLNQVPDATNSLVRMREDLLRFGRENEALLALDLDFKHLFASWFNRGFLVLRRISWESPAHILEKVIAYEAVHAIDSWDALRRRLQPGDRRCYAFFHPAMPDEPLIFVEVALTKGIPGSVQNLLDDSAEALDQTQADTAVFYSISNCQPGLSGISFGQSLIKQVAEDLSHELPTLKTFVTLSPLPGFARWLHSTETKPDGSVVTLAAYYLTMAKRSDGLPLDPVSRFHLGNGAQIYALHENADTSAKGQSQSHGFMVNYLYDLSQVSANHEAFATAGQIAATRNILDQAAQAKAVFEKEAAQ